MDELKRVFWEESRELLTAMDHALGTVRREQLMAAELYRLVHTMKGAAATVGLQAVTRFCAELEHLLERNQGPLSGAAYGLLVDGRNHLTRLLGCELDGAVIDWETLRYGRDLIEQLETVMPAAASGNTGRCRQCGWSRAEA